MYSVCVNLLSYLFSSMKKGTLISHPGRQAHLKGSCEFSCSCLSQVMEPNPSLHSVTRWKDADLH